MNIYLLTNLPTHFNLSMTSWRCRRNVVNSYRLFLYWNVSHKLCSSYRNFAHKHFTRKEELRIQIRSIQIYMAFELPKTCLKIACRSPVWFINDSCPCQASLKTSKISLTFYWKAMHFVTETEFFIIKKLMNRAKISVAKT